MLLVSSAQMLGGAERSLLELAAELMVRGKYQWNPCIIASNHNESLAQGCKQLKVPFVHVPMPNLTAFARLSQAQVHLLELGKLTLRLREQVKTRDAKLVHMNGAKAALCVLPAVWWCGVPCVWHVRDYPKNVRVERVIGRIADAIIVPSAYMRDALVEYKIGRKDKIHLVPNGVRKASPREEEIAKFRSSLGVREDAQIVTMVAQMAPWKRHDVFLEAVAMLRRSMTIPIHAVIAGGDLWSRDSGYVATLQRRSEQPDLRGAVTFLGQIPGAAPLLACSDIVVLPSDREPFGRVVIEAWHTSKPVVVTDLGCPCELIEDGRTGLVFAHGDSQALANCLERLLSDPTLRFELGRNGNLQAEQYTPARHAAAISGIYSGLLR